MPRDEHRLPAPGRRFEGNASAAFLVAVGGALVAIALFAFAGLEPGERHPIRFASFVVLPVAIMITFVASRGRRRSLLLLLVALLDLEAAAVGELPVLGLPATLAVPLLGVAYVTYLLPVETLPFVYVGGWLASAAGVTLGAATWIEPGSFPMPTWALIPILFGIAAAGLLVLWQVSSGRADALKALTEADSRFRELLDGVDLLAIDVDASGTIRFFNEYGARLLGWDRDQAVGRDWYEVFVPDERRDEARARLRGMVDGTETLPRHRESQVQTRSGERRLIRWSHVARHDASGRFASMASIGEDVTGVREAEEAFRRVSELNNALIAGSPVPTVVIGLDRTVQLWNPAAAQLLGYTAEELLGRPFPNVVPPQADRPRSPGVFEAVTAGTDVRGSEVPMTRRDGTPLLVRVYATALRDADGKPFAIAAQAVDVTAQAAMEARLRESQKMEAVGRLAGGVAHDFNNSLTAIGGFAALIAASTDDPEIQQEAESISASVRRSANLTRELLAYARRSLLQPEALEVNALVGAVRPMLRRLIGEDIRLVIESGTPHATVRVDPGQLEQALLNLAVNARDAMPDGGQITIRTGRRVVPATDAEGVERAMVTISVSDTGSGIPLDVQSQVFDPFFTTKPVGVGTGLGLAMVQGFVVQSGGDVTLISDPGRGTTVEIRLPEVTDVKAADAPVPEPAVAGGAGETILFVEDEPSVAAVGFQVLSRRGYRVLLADSGTAAIALLRAHAGPIALVLSDVILPDMRGPQVAEVAAATHPEAAILFASGYSADTFVTRGEMAPGVALIEKPYSPAQLVERARRAIEQRAVETGESVHAG